MITDKMRLDWLESKTDGSNWIARKSTSGRGFRLHNVTGMEYVGQPTARDAIDVAILEDNKRRHAGMTK